MQQDAGLAEELKKLYPPLAAAQAVTHELAFQTALANSKIQRDPRFRINHPELLFGDARGRDQSAPNFPLALIQTLHMDTLLSASGAAAPVANGQVHPQILRFACQLRNRGATAIYLIGTFESSAYSELMLQYFKDTWEQPKAAGINWRPWVGASVFSVDNYAPNLRIGSREDLKLLVATLKKEAGLTVVPCLVTNTLGIGGLMARQGLEHIADYPQKMRPCNELELFQEICSHPERHGAKRIWQSALSRAVGSSPGSHTLEILEFPVPYQPSWQHRLFHYEYRGQDGTSHQTFTVLDPAAGFLPFCWIIDQSPGSQQTQVFLKKLGSQNPRELYVPPKDVWGDTLQLKVCGDIHNAQTLKAINWFAEQYAQATRGIFEYVRADMAHLPDKNFWRQFQDDLARFSSPHPAPRFIAEAYGGIHGDLVNLGLSPYAKYILEWLEKGEISALHTYLFSLGGALFLRNCVGFTANHDDQASGSKVQQVAHFAAVVSMPFGKVLVAQGQLDGLSDFRIGADMHVPHEDFKKLYLKPVLDERRNGGKGNWEFLKCMRTLSRLAKLAIFRDPSSAAYPAVFTSHQNPHNKEVFGVFHISRRYASPCGREDRVATIVDYQATHRGSNHLVLNIRDTFGLGTQDLSNYSLVSLLTGRSYPAGEVHELIPEHEGLPFHTEVYILALVPRTTLEKQILH